MAKRQFQLTEAQVEELIAAYSRSDDGFARTRLMAVWLYGTGYPVKEIIENAQCSRTSLMEWCKKYLEHGASALADHRTGGNSRKLTSDQISDLKERLHRYTPRELFGSEAATSEGQFWTVEYLRHAVEHWYGVSYRSNTSCLTLFERCGFSYHRPAKAFKSRREVVSASLDQTVETSS
jgi:transposase